jgi:hypothetical protein
VTPAAAILPVLTVDLAAGRAHAIWAWAWLWLLLIIVCVALLRLVASLGERRRKALWPFQRRRRRRHIKDAWVEAGRRAEPLPAEDEADEEPEGGS